jgi:hypothetical protein
MTQKEGRRTASEITCQEIVQWVSAYLDEHVGDVRRHQIAVHLAICAGCETYVKQIKTVRDVVRLLPKTIEESPRSHQLRQAMAAQARRVRAGG